nr:outer membrane beta-barrel protein [Qipengyuania proteolytica]
MHSPLAAQSLPDTAGAIPRNDPEYEIQPTQVGPFAVTVGAASNVYYDDNIYAADANEVDDIVFEVAPFARAVYDAGPLNVAFGTQSNIRRYADRSTENSEATRFTTDLTFSPNQGESLRVGASYAREIEDRGDPEALNQVLDGPRRIDVWKADANYRRTRGKLLFDLRAEIAKFDALAASDANRDFRSYGGDATVGFRIGGAVFATATGFVNRREFRLSTTTAGIERDSTTIGGRVGLDIEPGGLVQGNISVGVFRNNPDDPSLDAQSGLSLAGNLIYRPRPRTAFVASVSRGDVATFRNAPGGRVDTVASLAVHQEIRHNLFAYIVGAYVQNDFQQTGSTDRTGLFQGELEYVVNRNLSIVADASYSTRDSDVPTEEFARFRGGIGVRIRF